MYQYSANPAETHTFRDQVALMKILLGCMSRPVSRGRGKVIQAAEVTLSSMFLIALFEERVEIWTCHTFSLGLVQ